MKALTQGHGGETMRKNLTAVWSNSAFERMLLVPHSTFSLEEVELRKMRTSVSVEWNQHFVGRATSWQAGLGPMDLKSIKDW